MSEDVKCLKILKENIPLKDTDHNEYNNDDLTKFYHELLSIAKKFDLGENISLKLSMKSLHQNTFLQFKFHEDYQKKLKMKSSSK